MSEKTFKKNLAHISSQQKKNPVRENNQYLPEGALRSFSTPASCTRAYLEKAAEEKLILESSCVMCDCSSMQLSVELPDGIRGIIPKSEVCYAPLGEEIKDIAVITRVGKSVQFKISEIYGNTAILSRKDAQKECFDKYISNLIPGDIIPARITHLEAFGAFCDIGCGLVSLLTVDKISVSRISHPSDRFVSGEYIDAVVSSVEDSGRIYLSHRELLGTWEENASFFSPGQTVTGVIRSVEDYGVFVELTPNLAGLAEMFEGATPGEKCSVYIKSIIPEKMKIKLVIIDTCGPADLQPCKYFIDPSVTHMNRWIYSPEGCRKTVESVFVPTCSRQLSEMI